MRGKEGGGSGEEETQQRKYKQGTHLEAGEHEYFVGEDLNGVSIEVEGDELAEIADGLQRGIMKEKRSRIARCGCCTCGTTLILLPSSRSSDSAVLRTRYVIFGRKH